MVTKKHMNFTQQLKDSIYNPEFYTSLKTGPTRHALSYFFKLSCLLALLSTIIFSVVFIPRFIKITSQESIDSFIEIFPKELTLTIQAGHLSTNVPEPYIIKMPPALGAAMNTKGATTTEEALVVISTQSDPNISDIDQILANYKSHVLVTGTNIISKDDNGKITVQSLSNFPNTSINQDKFREFANKFRPLLKFLVPIGIPFIFLAFLIYLNLNLILGLVLAVLVLALGKIFKWDLNYWSSYSVTLHSMTLGIILVFIMNTLLSFISFQFYLPRFIFSFIALLVIYVNLRTTSTPSLA